MCVKIAIDKRRNKMTLKGSNIPCKALSIRVNNYERLKDRLYILSNA